MTLLGNGSSDAEGNPLDWPGWTEVAPDVWVEGDEWDWVRPTVTVILTINPSQIAQIGYPPASPVCSANPPGTALTAVPGPPQVSSALPPIPLSEGLPPTR